ncbi:MAG: DNA polymerase III subunit alpha, partial [Planctomycetota bacterium]
DLYQQDAAIKQTIDIAKRLEGLCRNAGCHAAGVVIAEQPLDDLVPLYVDKDGNTLTQFEGPIVEKCGLLKMDFLGLRTLTVLQRSVDLVKQTKGLDVDIDGLTWDDQTVLDLFRRGETKGVFQFESGGMQDLLMKMKPDRLEDLIAANALYRPGPMELIPSYCARKHGREDVPSVHPLMDEILEETYGIMVYQEQVMRIFNRLGGIELRAAYSLIKAISKKKSDVIAKFKPQFIEGAAERGLAKSTAEEIFKLILKFGGYGFNKSHSTRYAMVAYQTAYMKTYHPVEYMAALLTFDAGNTEKVVEYIGECGRVLHPDGSRGVDVLPPDVNESGKDFTPVYARGKKADSGKIRFGLTAIRGVGEKAVECVMADRDEGGPFKSIFDFCERVDTRTVQKSTLDALVRCGAFSSIHKQRAPVLLAMERAYEMGQQMQDDKRSGQTALFGAPEEPAAGTVDESLPKVKELAPSELLKFEKELLGIYLSSHPLTEHQAAVDRYTTANVAEAMNHGEGTEVVIGSMISAVRPKVAKSGRSAGQKWAIVEFEDLSGKIEGMCFAEAFAGIENDYPGAIKKDTIVFVRAKVDRRRETPCLIVHDIIPADAAAAKLTTAIKIALDPLRHTPETMTELKPLLKKHSGGCDVYAQFNSDKVCGGTKTLTLRFAQELRVRPTPEFVSDVERVLGNATVDLIGEGLRRLKRLEQQRLFKGDESPVDVEVAVAVEEVGIDDAIDEDGDD